jgi:hypothetical protein
MGTAPANARIAATLRLLGLLNIVKWVKLRENCSTITNLRSLVEQILTQCAIIAADIEDLSKSRDRLAILISIKLWKQD